MKDIRKNWFLYAVISLWMIDSYYDYKTDKLQNERIEMLENAQKETKCIIEQEASSLLLINKQ
jgi:hypothetical protein